MLAISLGFGKAVGLSMVNFSPLVFVTIYETLGAVVIRSRSNSLSSLSSMISMCKSPKNPQRNPKPRAVETSGSKLKDASLSCNFKRASLRSSYLAPSAGKTPV